MTAKREEIRRRLAAIEHQRWAHWQKWMHEQCDEVNGHLVIPPGLVQRWERQIATPFEELSEGEQASDLEQVDRYWPLIEPILERTRSLEYELLVANEEKALHDSEYDLLRKHAERVGAAAQELRDAAAEYVADQALGAPPGLEGAVQDFDAVLADARQEVIAEIEGGR